MEAPWRGYTTHPIQDWPHARRVSCWRFARPKSSLWERKDEDSDESRSWSPWKHQKGTILSFNAQLKAFRSPSLIGAGSKGPTPGKFECISRRRSAWCTKAELSDRADSETPRRLPQSTRSATACGVIFCRSATSRHCYEIKWKTASHFDSGDRIAPRVRMPSACHWRRERSSLRRGEERDQKVMGATAGAEVRWNPLSRFKRQWVSLAPKQLPPL